MPQQDNGEDEPCESEPDNSGIQTVCDIDEVSLAGFPYSPGCSECLSCRVCLGRAGADREDQWIAEVDHIEEHPQHRTQTSCTGKQNCRGQPLSPRDNRDDDAGTRCQRPSFVSSPGAGKCKQTGKAKILPRLFVSPPDQEIQQPRGAEDHEGFIFRCAEQVNDMWVECKKQKRDPTHQRSSSPCISRRKQKNACSYKRCHADQAACSAVPPERIDRRERSHQNMRQRQPHGAELAKSGREVVEKAPRL